MTEADSIHVHRLDEQHVLDVLLFRQCPTGLWTERMTVYALEDNLLSVDEHAILLTTIDVSASFMVCFAAQRIRMSVFDSAETKLLTFHMEWMALNVFQRKDSSIEIRLLCIPKFGILHGEVNPCPIAGRGDVWAGCHLTSIGVNNIDAYRTTSHRTIQKYIGHKPPIGFGVNGHAADVCCWLRNNKHRAPDASKVPIIGTAFSQVYLWNAAFLQHLNLQAVLL